MNIPEFTNAEVVFGDIKLMPSYESIPEDFKSDYSDNKDAKKWREFFDDMFFFGLKDNFKLYPREGVDPQRALRHIKAISRSFQPKHEHKQAAVAYLMSQYFEDGSWERAEKS